MWFWKCVAEEEVALNSIFLFFKTPKVYLWFLWIFTVDFYFFLLLFIIKSSNKPQLVLFSTEISKNWHLFFYFSIKSMENKPHFCESSRLVCLLVCFLFLRLYAFQFITAGSHGSHLIFFFIPSNTWWKGSTEGAVYKALSDIINMWKELVKYKVMPVLPLWLQIFPLCTSFFPKYSSAGLFPVLNLPFPTEQMIHHFCIYIDSDVKLDKDASETKMIEEWEKLIYEILTCGRALVLCTLEAYWEYL